MCVVLFVQVVTFFSDKLEKTGPSPYSSEFVLTTIEQTAKAWPRDRLRVSSAIIVSNRTVLYTCTVPHKYSYCRWLRVIL